MTAPMSSPIPREALPYQGQEAGLITRATAAVIDTAVVGLALFGSYVGLAAALFALDPRRSTWPDLGVLFTVTVAAGYAIVYLTAAWWIAGRTVGCEVMGLRVVGLRGGNPAFLVALLRAVMYTFFAVGLLWCAVSPRRRSVQDILVGTSVIYDWRHHG